MSFTAYNVQAIRSKILQMNFGVKSTTLLEKVKKKHRK